MAEQKGTGEESTTKEANSGGSNGGHKGAVRAAAIAAATGATALAARKAFSGKSQSSRTRQKSDGGRSGGDDSMIGAMIGSGWGAAMDSLLPFAEEAAGAAGQWVGQNGPEIVRDTLVPRFIDGFERGRGSADDSK